MSSLANFDETRVEDLDALDGRSIDFPWEELFSRIDNQPEDLRAELRQDLAAGLGEMLRWLIRGDGQDRLYVRGQIAGCRAIALAWVLSPDIFDGTPSLCALAERLGVPRATLSRHTADVTKRWGILNRAQAPHHKATRRKLSN